MYVKLNRDQSEALLAAFGVRFEKRAPKEGVQADSITEFTIRKKESTWSVNGYETVMKKEDMVKAGASSMKHGCSASSPREPWCVQLALSWVQGEELD